MNYRTVGPDVEVKKFLPAYLLERFPEIDRLRVGIGHSGAGNKPITIYAHGVPETGIGPYQILSRYPATSKTQKGAIEEARGLLNEEQVIRLLLQHFGIETPDFK